MYIIFLIIISISIFLYFREHSKVVIQEAELSYICKRIEAIIEEDQRAYLMVPSRNEITRKSAASINLLLESYYKKQMEFDNFQKTMKYVLTNVSHDLNTPLTVLKGYTEILDIKLKQNNIEEVKINSLKVQKQTEEIIEIVSQFFNMAKLESGDAVFNIEKLDVGKICREVIMEFYDLLEQNDYSTYINIPESPMYAHISEEALVRILKNLIGNAIKYGDDGKYIGVTVEESKNQILIHIEDHGRGIDCKEKELIFDRTYTLAKRYGKHCRGSGLGLAISKKLATQMGADISFISEPWIRTIFTVNFLKS